MIDSHIHIGKTEKTSRFLTLETCTYLMDQNEIDWAVVMPNVSSVINDSELNIDFMVNDFPEILFPFILIDPNDFLTYVQIDTYKWKENQSQEALSKRHSNP